MERSELVSSAASGSYGLTQTENDDTLSEGCSGDTLNLVEDAILRTLKMHSSHTPERDLEEPRAGRTRLRERSNNARDEEQQSAVSESAPPAKSSNPQDMTLLANLLEQVHALRRNQRQGSRKHKETPPTEAQDILKHVRRRGREKKSSSSTEELRMTLEAAVMAAKAAADAAEAAAASVARNTEAIEFVVNSMKSSKKRRESESAAAVDEKKAIVKSNQTTHWILGLMAVSTIAWRFGVVKVAKRISSKLNDPIAYVGGLMGNNDSPTKEDLEKSSEKGNFLDKLPHIDFPEFLPNDADHQPNDKETHAKETKQTKAKETNLFAKSAAAVDVKAKEAEKTAFSFANLLQTKANKT